MYYLFKCRVVEIAISDNSEEGLIMTNEIIDNAEKSEYNQER